MSSRLLKGHAAAFLAADHHRCILAADHHRCLVLLHVDVVPEVFGACLGASDDRGSLSHHSTARPFYFLKGYSHCHLQSRQKNVVSEVFELGAQRRCGCPD